MKKATAVIAAVVVVVVVVAAAILIAMQPVPPPGKVIYWTQVAPVNQEAQLASGAIQGGVSWEPYVSDSLLAGTGTALVWSGDVWPNHPCCVVAMKTGFNFDLAARVVRAHIDANAWMADAIAHPDSANYTLLMQMGADFSNRNVSVVANSVEHVKYGYELSADVLSGIRMFTEDFIALNQTSNATLHSRGYATVDDFVSSFVDTSVIEAAMQVTYSPTIIGTVSLGYLTGDLHQFARVVAMNTTIWGGQNLFAKYGVNIQTPNPGGYANGGDEMTAFAAGTIDMGYLGVPPTILKTLNADTHVKVVALVNSEGSAIVVKTGITSFDELEGKTVATPGPASIQHLLLLYYANQHGYTVKLVGT
jgi:NitT/TauT family transport system substrate-binding protein